MTARLLVPALLAAGCGGSGAASQPPAETEPTVFHPRATEPDDVEDGLAIEGTRGHLEPHQIEEGLAPHKARLGACYQDALRKVRFLAGDVELGFVVAPAGAVSSVAIAKSDLGSWAVERCLLAEARQVRFAKPRGGRDAEFSIPLEFQSGRGRVVWWPEQRAETEVAKRRPDLIACDEANPRGAGEVGVVLYVGPRGEVRSVGFDSQAGAIGEAWADCAATAVRAWSLTDPRGTIAKLRFVHPAA